MTFRFVPAGDSVLVVEGPDRLDVEVNRAVIQLAEAMQGAGLRGVRDIVPSYRSVAIYFDPLLVERVAVETRARHEIGRLSALDTARDDPENVEASAEASPEGRSRIRVPVCYGGEHGPDLPEVAALTGVNEAEVVSRHAGRVYRVYMLGFLPGFAYLGTVDERIAAPRRSSPRVRVPVGSVGIAGVQTGIYPVESPGGWQLIGRTPLRPFDWRRVEPCLFRAGDEVEFYPITEAECSRIGGFT